MASAPPSKKKKGIGPAESATCIVHIEGLIYGEIKLFSSLKDPETRRQRLCDIRSRRLAQPAGSVHRMDETCSLIPDVILPHHGYHLACYQRFSMNQDRLKDACTGAQTSTSRPQRPSLREGTIFHPDCIFCNCVSRKKVKVKGSWTTEGLAFFEKEGWKTILDRAVNYNDDKLLTRIRGYDLFACKAKYHKSCRTNYLQNPRKWRSLNEDEKVEQRRLENSHAIAFSAICKVIDYDVLMKKNIVTLTDLRTQYVAKLEETPHPNSEYRSENLKTKLERHYDNRIAFCSLGSFKSYILYRTDIDVNSVVRRAYELGSKDVIQQAGDQLHEVNIDIFNYDHIEGQFINMSYTLFYFYIVRKLFLHSMLRRIQNGRQMQMI